MTSPVVARVTMPCAPRTTPTLTASTHRLDVHADGSVTTLDHDNEPWAGSNLVEHALGGNFTWTPCDWWRAVSLPAVIDFCVAERLRVSEGTQPQPRPNFDDSNLTPDAWEIAVCREWTLAADYTKHAALGLIASPTPQDLRKVDLTSPLFRVLREIAREHPDPETVLAAPEAFTVPARSDHVYAFGVGVLEAVRARNTVNRWQAAGRAFATIAQSEQRAVSLLLAAGWMDMKPTIDLSPPEDILEGFIPVLEEFGLLGMAGAPSKLHSPGRGK